MSGAYNVFTLRKGTTLAKATLDEAFAEVKMEVESYEKEERVRPASAVAVEVEAKAVG
ncbi:MAG: hypothetical protein ACF8XB_19950 [Planctomycetota bacterium JB042]